jgi:hypothetical protein
MRAKPASFKGLSYGAGMGANPHDAVCWAEFGQRVNALVSAFFSGGLALAIKVLYLAGRKVRICTSGSPHVEAW